MPLASIEAYLSRPIAPTRRIALGDLHLPIDTAPGSGGVLLAGIMARFSRELDADTDEALSVLLDLLESGVRVAQPQLRHRMQVDRVGLMKARYHLESEDGRFRFRFDSRVGSATQHVLAAAYAGATLSGTDRAAAFAAMRKGLDWGGAVDDRFVRFVADRRHLGATVGSDPVGWAMTVLGIERAAPSDSESDDTGAATAREQFHIAITGAFRRQLIAAHPDQGGDPERAADRIADIGEARRILLSR